jgi:hypothetical protein
MDSQQEGLSPPPDRPSFFGLPASLRLWARVGATFWGGLLSGIGIGLFTAKILEELEVPRRAWLGLLAVVLVAIGQAIALQAVRRSSQPDRAGPVVISPSASDHRVHIPGGLDE